jgi:DNA repair protein RadD
MILRDYQTNTINAVRDKAKEGKKRVVIVLPTGAGKTTVAAEMIRLMLMHGRRVLFIVHRQELAFQARGRFFDFNIPTDIEMGKYKGGGMPVTIASIQTLSRRGYMPKDIVFVDECHHAVSASYKKVLEQYMDGHIYGLTATPYRLDRKRLGEIFQDVVAVTNNLELIAHGHLVEARYWAAAELIDTKDIKITAGEYNNKDLFCAADKPALYKNVVKNYKKHCPNGERAIVFNVNKQHSKKTAQEFLDQGVPAMHLDCDTPSSKRIEILDMYAAGVFQVLCNVAILTEGYDLPSVHCIILNKATTSKALYMQMIGRALRPSLYKKNAIVVDHARNVIDHGYIEDELEFDIHKEKKKGPKKDAPVKVCPGIDDVECGALVHAAVMTCPECGYEFPQSIMEEKEGEFKELVRLDFRKMKNKVELPPHLHKPWATMTRGELEEVAGIRNYKPGWVYKQLERSMINV